MSNFFSSSKELDERIGKKTKLLLLLFLFTLGILIFLGSILHTAIKERHIPQLVISETNRALRGDILSQDGFKLSFSQKLYKAMVNTNNIDPDKKELFIDNLKTKNTSVTFELIDKDDAAKLDKELKIYEHNKNKESLPFHITKKAIKKIKKIQIQILFA